MAINGNVCTSYPRVASAGLDAGWEFMGHGFLQGPMHRLPDQRDAIWRAMDGIEAFCGKRPRSWESPGLTETEETLDLLRESGVEYVADWVMDDLPQEIDTPHGVITSIPYTVEVNDITVYALQQHDSDVFLTRGQRHFDRLYQEAQDNVRVMAISVHPYITGVPHRIAALEGLLDYIGGHEGVAWMTASEIGDWYRGQMAGF